LLSLSLNFCLCLDIVLTMSSPFSPHDRRMKFYIIISGCIATIATKMTMGSRMIMKFNDGGLVNPEELVENGINKQAAWGVGVLTLYILYSVFSIAYAYRLNTRPGFSSGVRSAFISNHVQYVLTYIATWTPYMGWCLFMLFTLDGLIWLQQQPSEEKYTEGITRIISGQRTWYMLVTMVSMCTGLLMSFVRMKEPMFKRQIAIYWNQYWGELPPDTDTLTYEQEKSNVEGTLLSFLMSSLNVELVHIILHVVSSQTVGVPKSKADHRVY